IRIGCTAQMSITCKPYMGFIQPNAFHVFIIPGIAFGVTCYSKIVIIILKMFHGIAQVNYCLRRWWRGWATISNFAQKTAYTIWIGCFAIIRIPVVVGRIRTYEIITSVAKVHIAPIAKVSTVVCILGTVIYIIMQKGGLINILIGRRIVLVCHQVHFHAKF